MFRRSVPALILVLSVCTPAQAQNRPQFRSGVEVTSIDVTVVDNRGRSIPDLKPGEFLVRVVNLGVGGKSVSFTTDRAKTKQVVSKSVGGVPYPPSTKTAGEQTFNT